MPSPSSDSRGTSLGTVIWIISLYSDQRIVASPGDDRTRNLATCSARPIPVPLWILFWQICLLRYGICFWSPPCSVSTKSMDRSGDPPLSEQLHVLREDAPGRYALLERYHADLKRILEHSPRNYASTKQLHATWEDPPFQPQILGQLLSTIADLGVLRIHAHRSNRNRYDLTAYNSTRMHELATLFTGEAESTPHQSPCDQ